MLLFSSYWKISGISITLNGYGVAYEQSISPNSSISKDDNVVVNFKSINSNIDVSSKNDDENSEEIVEE